MLSNLKQRHNFFQLYKFTLIFMKIQEVKYFKTYLIEILPYIVNLC